MACIHNQFIYFEFRYIVDEDELSVRVVFQIASGCDPGQQSLHLLHRPRSDHTNFDHKFRLTRVSDGHIGSDGLELVLVNFATVDSANDDEIMTIIVYLT